MKQPIRVLLADDHAFVREGTRELLEREIDILVVGEASNGAEAVRLVETLQPDVVVMDVRMPGMGGVEATKQIKERFPAVEVLVMTAHDDDEFVFALLEAGASGYMLKTGTVKELIRAIHEVAGGQSALDPIIARKVVQQIAGGTPRQKQREAYEALTEREQEVLALLAEGKSNKEIAESLIISDRTVQTHLSNIFGKMGVSSRTEAVLEAIRRGWLTID
ncbi:MAG: response regulator transcription factor [Ardenticatenales bacterium]|nr:response regulator transcription factor [Ardenticatenales bacterium]